jgi:hypothetical protein
VDIEKARVLIDKTAVDLSQKQRILRGLQIIAKYDDDIECILEYDEMYASNFSKTVVQMTEEEVKELARLGWNESGVNSWSYYKA